MQTRRNGVSRTDPYEKYAGLPMADGRAFGFSVAVRPAPDRGRTEWEWHGGVNNPVKIEPGQIDEWESLIPTMPWKMEARYVDPGKKTVYFFREDSH